MFGTLSTKKDGAAERLKRHKVKCTELRAKQTERMSTLDKLNAELKKAVDETAATAVSIISQLNNGCNISVKKERKKRSPVTV